MLKRLLVLLALPGFLGACTSAKDSKQTVMALDSSATRSQPHESQDLLTRMAFGSCNKTDLPQPLFRKLAMDKPQLWAWTGDVIYGDSPNPADLAQQYRRQLQQPDYATFLGTGVHVIGTYDDHDFGEGNGGRDYPDRSASMKLFLDFVNEPKDSPRRQQEGIYARYRLGPDGKRVKILVTDNRYNREKAGKDSDILGAAQWQWLEKEMLGVDAELLVLVSGTQVLPFEHRWEKWADWPAARTRLLNLIDRSPYRTIIIISGDRHLAEVSKADLPSGKTLWEVTSSGLTHSYQAATPEKSPNSLRVGPLMTSLNYGIMDINWESTQPQVILEVRDINREAIIRQTVPLVKP